MQVKNNNSDNNPGQRLDSYPSSKFGVVGVEINGVVVAEFTEVSGLEAEVEVFEYIEGGNNLFTYKLPGRVKYPNVTLRHGITDTTDLWDWFYMVMNRTVEKTKTPKEPIDPIERKNITLIQYDGSGTKKREWNLVNAYPVKWTGPSFKADENAITIEAIELVHQGLTMDKK